jgi:putative flippase GtrA
VNYFVANAISLSVCSVVNLAAHWSYTLRRRRPSKLWPLVAGAVLALCLSVLATSSCLALAFTLVSRSFLATVSALLVGTAVAALGRFLVFQALVFRTELRHRSS